MISHIVRRDPELEQNGLVVHGLLSILFSVLLHKADKQPSGVPEGWEKETFAAGGLMHIGFSNVCFEKLIVISSQGQGVINCETDKKIYCGENYDEDDLIAPTEELGDEIVPTAGDDGSGLYRELP